MKYKIESVEHVYDAFDEYEHTNKIAPVYVDARSIDEAGKIGIDIIQKSLTDQRREGGYLSSGEFIIEIKSILQIGEADREQYSGWSSKELPGLNHDSPSFVVNEKKIQVFLCHASEDKQIVRDIYKRLMDNGYKPWLDEIDLLPGTNWDNEIKQAVRSSDAVIVCISKNSITKEGYIQKEIKQILDIADEKLEDAIFIIPLKLEDCNIPNRLSKWHFVLYNDHGFGKLLHSLNRRKEQLKQRDAK